MKFKHILAFWFLVAGVGSSSASAAGQLVGQGEPVVSPEALPATAKPLCRSTRIKLISRPHTLVWNTLSGRSNKFV